MAEKRVYCLVCVWLAVFALPCTLTDVLLCTLSLLWARRHSYARWPRWKALADALGNKSVRCKVWHATVHMETVLLNRSNVISAAWSRSPTSVENIVLCWHSCTGCFLTFHTSRSRGKRSDTCLSGPQLERSDMQLFAFSINWRERRVPVIVHYRRHWSCQS